MKNKFHKMLKSTGKGIINFCLAYGLFVQLGHFCVVFLGEPKFPED
jgi:hypothetical protein